MAEPSPDPVKRSLLGPELDDALDRWRGDAATDDAVRRRSSARWLRRQAEEEGTFAGMLVDLGEQGGVVVVQTWGERTHTGRVTAVGADFVTLRVAGAGEVLVAFRAVCSVRVPPGEPMPVGDHSVLSGLSLAEMIVQLMGERERATFVPVSGGGPVCGTVCAVGQDVVTIALDGDRSSAAGHACMPLDAVGEVIPKV